MLQSWLVEYIFQDLPLKCTQRAVDTCHTNKKGLPQWGLAHTLVETILDIYFFLLLKCFNTENLVSSYITSIMYSILVSYVKTDTARARGSQNSEDL